MIRMLSHLESPFSQNIKPRLAGIYTILSMHFLKDFNYKLNQPLFAYRMSPHLVHLLSAGLNQKTLAFSSCSFQHRNSDEECLVDCVRPA